MGPDHIWSHNGVFSAYSIHSYHYIIGAYLNHFDQTHRVWRRTIGDIDLKIYIYVMDVSKASG